ncbi:Ubiquitin-conjugating enzyme E2 1 [Frankliniella fusca]|uniref:Ubiquitin-conjugating enzyme E2 1 n=1 Tax=Frankliniella fusca TaxID=407009 RepID=A0AAE1LRR7_9NEOP|nr:Ubiquitin-conjugating enzyme E2 1 [Frankliniella fusca]
MLNHPEIVLKDIARLAKSTSDIFLLDGSDMTSIKAAIAGKVGTPFEGGMFSVTISIPTEYPFKYPKFHIKDKIFHPNVHPYDGRVCVDLLKEKWSPSITLYAACEVIQALMGEPNPDSPLNVDAACMMGKNREMYDRTALTWTKHFASGVHSYPPYEEMIQQVTELNGSKKAAIKLLTAASWDVEVACNQVI